MCLAGVDKNFEFWRTRLRGTPIATSPTFVMFQLMFNTGHSENFTYLAQNNSKLQKFEGMFEGVMPKWHPDFR